MADIYGHSKAFNVEKVATLAEFNALNTKVGTIDTKLTQILGGGFGQRTIYNTVTPKTNTSSGRIVNGGLDIDREGLDGADIDKWDVYNAISATVDSSYTSIDIDGWAYINKNAFWKSTDASKASIYSSWGLDLLNLGDINHLNMPILYKTADSQGRIDWSGPNRAQRWRFNSKDMIYSGVGNPDSDHSNWRFVGDVEFYNPKYDLMRPYGSNTDPYNPHYTLHLTVHPRTGQPDSSLDSWGEVRSSHDKYTKYFSTGTSTIYYGDTLRIINGNTINSTAVINGRWIQTNNAVVDYFIDGDMYVDIYPGVYNNPSTDPIATLGQDGKIYINGSPATVYTNANQGMAWKGAFVNHNHQTVDSGGNGSSGGTQVMSWWLVPGLINNYLDSDYTEPGVGAVGPGVGIRCVPLHHLPPETTIKYHVTLNILHPGGD